MLPYIQIAWLPRKQGCPTHPRHLSQARVFSAKACRQLPPGGVPASRTPHASSAAAVCCMPSSSARCRWSAPQSPQPLAAASPPSATNLGTGAEGPVPWHWHVLRTQPAFQQACSLPSLPR